MFGSVDKFDEFGSAPQQAGSHMFPENWIVTGFLREDTQQVSWRCLLCLAGGAASSDTLPLAVAVHKPSCVGDIEVAAARSDILDIIAAISQEEFSAGWMGGIEGLLLKRSSIYLVLADFAGWPVGWRGLDGWDVDAASALARHRIDRAERVIVCGPRPDLFG